MTTLRAASTSAVTTKEQAPSLGSLLQNFRTELGESVKTVTRRCALGPVEIAQLELGRADLSADQLADAVAAYAVPRVIFPTGHSLVQVDLVAGLVSVHHAKTVVDETPADRTLLGYFELIFGASGLSPSTAIPFTALDLDVLRVVLSSRRNEVTEHLQFLVGPIEEPTVVPGRVMRGAMMAMASAAVIMAAVIASHNGGSSSPEIVVAPIGVQILDALVITRADAPSVTNPDGTPVEPSKESK